jgi:hypothetical protein
MNLNKSVLATAVACFATIMAVGEHANAAPCPTTGNFGQLESMGSCTIGDKTFSGFTYNPIESGGATEVLATAFDFTTINDVNNEWGFEFTFPLLPAPTSRTISLSVTP